MGCEIAAKKDFSHGIGAALVGVTCERAPMGGATGRGASTMECAMRRSPGIRLSTLAETCTSPAGDPWASLAAAIRGASSPWSCAAFGALYGLALAEGVQALRSFRDLDEARRADLALATLVTKLDAIAAADRPRAFFRKVLYRDAVSWRRSGRARVATEADAPERCAHGEGPCDAVECLALRRLDANAALGRLSDRQRAMLLADAEGYSREEIARAHATTRANVDQVLSRARRGAGV